ncbi:TonB-dependent receptor [Bacteroides thetaiotaomicron]|nr:TonB-dependent receptor [Bacteroides thetaiotaomicron]
MGKYRNFQCRSGPESVERQINIDSRCLCKNTNDVLLPVPYAASTGISGLSIQNAGQVRNKGFELSINWRSTIGDDFSYYIGANATTEKNEVTKITAGGNNMAISGYSISRCRRTRY